MDRSQTRLVVALSLLLAAVAALLWGQGRPTTEETDEATAPVWTVEQGRVRRLEIDRAEGGRLVLERRDDGWWVREPEEAVADAARVEDLAGQLAALRRAIPVESAPGEAFGLGTPPTARVRWVDDAGESQVLVVGERAPAAYRTYVLTAEGGVGAASGDPSALLLAPAEDYRDQRVFRFDPAEVRAVRIAFPEHVLDVRGEGRSWHLGGFGRAEPDRVDDLVMDLLDLRFDEEQPDLAVAEPRITVDVTLADGSAETLLLGPSEGFGFPARAPDGRTGRVFDGVEKMLGRGPTDVGQRTAFQLRLDVAERVVVTRGGRSFEAVRDGPGWTAPPLDPGVVYDRLSALSSLPVERTLAPAGPSDPPEATVTIHEPPPIDGGAPFVVTFLVGPIQPDGTRTVRDAAGPGPGVPVKASALDAALGALP